MDTARLGITGFGELQYRTHRVRLTPEGSRRYLGGEERYIILMQTYGTPLYIYPLYMKLLEIIFCAAELMAEKSGQSGGWS